MNEFIVISYVATACGFALYLHHKNKHTRHMPTSGVDSFVCGLLWPALVVMYLIMVLISLWIYLEGQRSE